MRVYRDDPLAVSKSGPMPARGDAAQGSGSDDAVTDESSVKPIV